MDEKDLLQLVSGKRLPYRTADEMIAFLAGVLDMGALSPDVIPQWQLRRVGEMAENCLNNRKSHYTMADFHYSLFRIIPNEKSAVFYKARHVKEEIHILIEHRTNTYFTDSSLLFVVLQIERGISDEDVQENGMRYLEYRSRFHDLEEELQEMEAYANEKKY